MPETHAYMLKSNDEDLESSSYIYKQQEAVKTLDN